MRLHVVRRLYDLASSIPPSSITRASCFQCSLSNDHCGLGRFTTCCLPVKGVPTVLCDTKAAFSNLNFNHFLLVKVSGDCERNMLRQRTVGVLSLPEQLGLHASRLKGFAREYIENRFVLNNDPQPPPIELALCRLQFSIYVWRIKPCQYPLSIVASSQRPKPGIRLCDRRIGHGISETSLLLSLKARIPSVAATDLSARPFIANWTFEGWRPEVLCHPLPGAAS